MRLSTLIVPALLLSAVGCGSARVAPVHVAPTQARTAPNLAHADSLLRQGCYACISDARAAYAAASDQGADVTQRLFETEVLLALREKELGLDWNASLGRARALAAELPDSIGAARVLRMTATALPNQAALPARVYAQQRAAYDAIARGLTDEVLWMRGSRFSSELRSYLPLAAECADMPAQRAQTVVVPMNDTPAPIVVGAAPLLLYRMSSCTLADTFALKRVRLEEPRFVETSYFLAREALKTADETGGGQAKEWLNEARAMFPRSSAITFLSAELHQVTGDCDAALGFYDATLVLQPSHDDALLGKVVCLTGMKRDSDAIAAATTLIEMQSPNTQKAYYWRAFNRHGRSELEMARSDIEKARVGPLTPEILTLAGIIEFDVNDLTAAESDMRAARKLQYGERNCTAAWYLGRIHTSNAQWPDATAQYEAAMQCYELNITQGNERVEAIRARTDIDPSYKSRRIERLETAIAESFKSQHASAFNAANYSARSGNLVRARELLTIAERDPGLSDLVSRLREVVK